MENERQCSSRSRERRRDRRFNRSKFSPEHVIDEQPEKKRRHRHHSHRDSSRSLSPGEIPPPGWHGSKRHRRCKSSEKRRRRHSESLQDSSPEHARTPDVGSAVAESGAPKTRSRDSSSPEDIYGPMPVHPTERQATTVTTSGRHGHTTEDIERFEQMGFIMSGKRRKKGQLQDTSKKAGLVLVKEEKALRESELVARFKEMIEAKGKNN